MAVIAVLKRWGTGLLNWWLRTWAKLRPGPETRPGVFWACVAVTLAAVYFGGSTLKSGFGEWVDLLFAVLVAVLGIGLVALLVALVMTILSRLPRMLSGLVLGSCLFASMILPPAGFVFVPLTAIFGAAVATVWKGNFGSVHISKKILTVVLGLASIATFITLTVILAGEGNEDDLVKLDVPATTPALQSPDPSQSGPLGVKTLFYGSGTDLRRPLEYGKGVTLKTPVVDASRFFKDFEGWKPWIRKKYWGFGMDQLPLNARVWYPDGAGPYPLVLIVHGNHDMAEFSDPGYQYLGELLASRGFILASIDENFLNSGLFHDPPKQQAVRGWMLLEHLTQWRKWNGEAGNPFQGKVDLDNIALMGHSRGGEAAATAAVFNKLRFDPEDATIPFSYGFHIKSVVAIAPPDGQYKPADSPRVLENVNYLTLQGANDGDVSTFMGSMQFDRVKFTDASGPWFKAEIYAYRANHGQFNTVWGRSDAGEPMGRYLNLKPLLPPEEQRRISKTYISAFLEATLKGKRDEYLALFRDYRAGRDWLPRTLYMNRFMDASYKVIADFSEDPDVTTTTIRGGSIHGENLSIWKEGRIPTRGGGRSSNRGYNGVFLGWNRGQSGKIPVYEIDLPAVTAADGGSIVFSLAATDEKVKEPGKTKADDKDEKSGAKPKDESTDFTVELESIHGEKQALPLSRYGTLMPMFRVHFTKFSMLDDYAYEKAAEPIFQTFQLPLKDFGISDASQVKAIRLRFDRTLMRQVILSHVGFEK